MFRLKQEILDICETIQTIVSNYTHEYSLIEQWFNHEDRFLIDYHKEEISKWLTEAEVYKEELKQQREQMLLIGRNQLLGLTSDESFYSVNDRSYSKRKDSGKLELDSSFEYPFLDNNEPLTQLEYIRRRMQELISIYSAKNPPHIIREVMSRKGTKRHQAYAEMEFLIHRAEVLVGLLDNSARAIGDLHNEIDHNAEMYVSSLKNSYNEKAKNLDLEFVKRVKVARSVFENNLQTLLPIDDITNLDLIALEQSVQAGLYQPSLEMPNQLWMGHFEYEVKIDNDYQYVTDVLKSMYGTYMETESILVLPLLIESASNHLVFINNRDQENVSINSIRGFVCRYLLHMPVASTNCYFVDGYHSGSCFKIFTPINEVDKKIVPNEVATSSQSINQLLDTILHSNESILQRRLLDFPTLYDFNHESGKIYERYSLLVIDNFPKGFNEESFDKLERIILKSQQCGVSIFINYNENLVQDDYGDISKWISRIKKGMDCYFHTNGLLFPQENVPCTIKLHSVPDSWKDLMQEYNNAIIASSAKSQPLEELLYNDGQLFARDSRKSLVIPFGISGPGREQNLIFGEGVSHSGLLVGTTGSGKSTLLNSIILSAIAHYSPDELELYLLDFKEGVEFALYANNPVPQIRFVSVESQQELGLSILQRLCDEIDRRSKALKDPVVQAKDLASYREKTGNRMPRILLIIDEFHRLFNVNTNYQIAEKCADLMNILITQGRSNGINVLMASQRIARLNDISINSGLYGQMQVRIALRCDVEDAEFMFKINPEIVDTFGSTKGAGAYSSEDSSPPQKFVTAYMDDDARTEFLRGVQSHYSTMGIQSNTIVYDGSKKVFFDSLMDETNMLSEIIKEDEDYKIVVGESLGTVKPIYIEFEPIGKNNLLLVDSQQELARHLFMTYVKCLLICKERDSEFKSVSPFIFFADYRIRKRSVKQNDELADLCLGCEEIYYGTTDSDIEMIMRTLYDEYKLRDSTNAISQPLFLVLFGLQNISKILDTFDGEVDSEATSSLFEENEDSNLNDLFNDDVEEKKSVGQIFRLLLQNGSKRSIFLLTWMDNNQSIKKLEYGDSDYFGNKILGKMSADDSDALVGMSIAAHITETQLIFSNINSEVQKLKQYL